MYHSKRTLVPWAVCADNRSGMTWNIEITDESGDNRICFMSHDDTRQNARGLANAAFIAHAVNCYDDLIEALVIIADQHIGDQPSAIDIDEAAWNARCHSNLRTIARQALVKAKGET